MKSLKELFSDTLVYGISNVFARFINYLLVPFYTGVFEPEVYGVVGLVYSAIVFLNVIFTLGMESSYIRYGKERESAADYFKTIQLFLLGASVVLFGAFWLAEPLLSPLLELTPETDQIYLLMLGILFFDTMTIVPFAELRLIQKSWTFAGLKTLNVLINLGLNFYLILGLNYGIEAVFISNLAASVITALIIWGITIRLWSGSWNGEYLQKALSFGLPFVPAGIGFAINEGIDRFFLGGLSDENVQSIYGIQESSEYIVGVYNANYKLAVFMLLLVQMFRMAWQPFFMRKSEDKEAPAMFAETFTYFNIAAALIFLVVSLFVEQIVAIKVPILDAYLIGKDYWMGLSIVPVLLMAYWFQGWYVNFSAGIFIAEKTKRLAQITLTGAVVTIIANIILVPVYGMLGSASATVLSYLTMAIMIYRYSTRSFNVPYNLWQGFAVVGVAAVAIYGKAFLSDRFFSDIATSIMILISAVILIGVLSFGHRLIIRKG